MIKGGDMIVGLYQLPTYEIASTIKIKRAFVGDKEIILDFVRQYFQRSWIYEIEHALMQEPSKCFIATEDGNVVGVACYDSTAKGFFGPIGIRPDKRNMNIGQALLVRTLESMKEYGYGYAVIGWVSDAENFYRKTVGAEYIKGGCPENSVYSNMVRME